MPPRHLELNFICSQTIPVFTRHRNSNAVFSANYNEKSLQRIRGVSTETWISMKGKTRAIYFSRRVRVPEDALQPNGRDIPVVNNATYLGITFDRTTTWIHHIERTVARALLTHVRPYSLFKSGRISTNIKLMLYKTLIGLVTTYACPTWEYEADDELLKLQHCRTEYSALF
jgi:hypothetical protein